MIGIIKVQIDDTPSKHTTVSLNLKHSLSKYLNVKMNDLISFAYKINESSLIEIDEQYIRKFCHVRDAEISISNYHWNQYFPEFKAITPGLTRGGFLKYK